MLSSLTLVSLLLASTAAAQGQYTPETAPDKTEEGQTGTNKCGTQSSQDSSCQNAYINSVTDFCLWAPPTNSSDYGSSAVGNTERIMVAWCTQEGRGTRVIPAGAITGAHFVKTPNYVQITGVGDFTKMNIPAGDDGGELDPHGADGNGNPIGGLVFSNAFSGSLQQITEWTNFMSSNAFSFRACVGEGAADYCQHIYDVMGAGWNAPGDYTTGTFDNCAGDSAEKPGVYSGSTFHQGDPSTPAAHAAGPTSQCTPFSTVGNATATSSSAMSSAAASSGVASAAASASVTAAAAAASNSAQPGASRSSSVAARPSASGPVSAANRGVAQVVGAVALGVAGVLGGMLV